MAQEGKTGITLPHNLILEGREKLMITAVEDVESFDESAALLRTSAGTLLIRGSGLKVTALSVESGDLALTGHVTQMDYAEPTGGEGGFFARLFR